MFFSSNPNNKICKNKEIIEKFGKITIHDAMNAYMEDADLSARISRELSYCCEDWMYSYVYQTCHELKIFRPYYLKVLEEGFIENEKFIAGFTHITKLDILIWNSSCDWEYRYVNAKKITGYQESKKNIFKVKKIMHSYGFALERNLVEFSPINKKGLQNLRQWHSHVFDIEEKINCFKKGKTYKKIQTDQEEEETKQSTSPPKKEDDENIFHFLD